ncbi:alpha/beta hydrolase [Planktotalea sp.]|uniref:alpha/beta hydrolase n=1 Tax=Planktotalea sp. TaxID=2029877 RepID=UPI00329762A6
MNPDSNSAALQSADKALRKSIKPMLRLIPSQRVINWLTYLSAKVTGITHKAARAEWIDQGGVAVLRITPDVVKHPDAAMLYFHGGAYVIGSPTSSENEARRLAISSGMAVYSVKYTTAIHAPYPAAVNDGVAAYNAIVASGVAPSQILLTGTSAGGGLVLAMLQRLIKEGGSLPAGVVTLSPWLDLTASHPSIDTLAEREAILTRTWISRAAKMYAADTNLRDPEVSPGFGSFKGSPPHLVLYSTAEIFRDEVEAFIEKLVEEEVSAHVGVNNHAPHAWPVLVDEAPETEVAFKMIAAFAEQHLS